MTCSFRSDGDPNGRPPKYPAKMPFPPMSFPPGVLPALVKERLRTEDMYTPLDPEDIKEVGECYLLLNTSYINSLICVNVIIVVTCLQ